MRRQYPRRRSMSGMGRKAEWRLLSMQTAIADIARCFIPGRVRIRNDAGTLNCGFPDVRGST